jgi:hypothetical protein
MPIRDSTSVTNFHLHYSDFLKGGPEANPGGNGFPAALLPVLPASLSTFPAPS